MDALRDEMYSCATINSKSNALKITYGALQDATLLDSFIREVLRTKGDTLSVCRKTTEDVLIAGKIIPKGVSSYECLNPLTLICLRVGSLVIPVV